MTSSLSAALRAKLPAPLENSTRYKTPIERFMVFKTDDEMAHEIAAVW
jgi:hypothetical protein